MKAISIRQPWAWAIVSSTKRVENRTWACKYRGPVLIHAAKSMTKDEYDDFRSFYDNEASVIGPPYPPDCPSYAEIQRGGIVGSAEIVDCVHEDDGRKAVRLGKPVPSGLDKPWFFGPFGIVLANVKALPFIPCKGALGLFDVQDDILTKADKQPDMLV